MKSFSVVLLTVIGSLMSGCVAYEVPHRESDSYQRDHREEDRGRLPPRVDRDRDGVPDRQDRYPNDSRHY